MKIELRPLDNQPIETLDSIVTALGVFLGSILAKDLDAGQFEMLREASLKIEQVTAELV